MRKRDIFWILVLILMGWAYVHFFTSVGVTRTISVVPSLRPPTGRVGKGALFPVLFTLDGTYSLTSVEVTTKATNQAEPNGHVLWHLVAKDGSDDVKFFFYGQNINGMDPDLEGVRTEALQDGVVYHLELKAGKIKGGTDFKTKTVSN